MAVFEICEWYRARHIVREFACEKVPWEGYLVKKNPVPMLQEHGTEGEGNQKAE